MDWVYRALVSYFAGSLVNKKSEPSVSSAWQMAAAWDGRGNWSPAYGYCKKRQCLYGGVRPSCPCTLLVCCRSRDSQSSCSLPFPAVLNRQAWPGSTSLANCLPKCLLSQKPTLRPNNLHFNRTRWRHGRGAAMILTHAQIDLRHPVKVTWEFQEMLWLLKKSSKEKG